MGKLFRWASWIGLAAFIRALSVKISKHPRLVRSLITAALNFTSFYCFFIVIYGIGLKLEPSLDHPDHALMSFGIKFVSTAAALLLAIGLYHFVRSIITTGKFVADKVADVNKGFKDSGTVVIEIPKKTVETVKHSIEATTQWAERTGAEIKKVTSAGTKKCRDALSEKVPGWGGAIRSTTQKTALGFKNAFSKSQSWSKEKIPRVTDRFHAITAAVARQMKGRRSPKNRDGAGTETAENDATTTR